MESNLEPSFEQHYPEVIKLKKNLSNLDIEDLSSSTSSSGSLPSYTSDVSCPESQSNLFHDKHISPSLCNIFKPSSSVADSFVCNVPDEPEKSISSEEDEDQFSEDFDHKKEYDHNVQLLTDPDGWIKYASDPDPWNEKHYCRDDHSLTCQNGILTYEVISACLSKLEQLPDTKEFVLTRLHINKKGLEDISILSSYKYFQYLDVSWNILTDLQGLSNCVYLMYLNASHNKLSTVLDITPPRFLTHVNLSYNEIKEIGQNLSEFWSLRHIDLSYNLIGKIEGLHNLKYLKYFNLSHNCITKIENLDCVNLEEFYLQFNEISECDKEGAGFHVLRNIKVLNLASNKLSSLLPLKDLYSLKKLDISNNCITDLFEIDHLTQFTKFIELNVTGNSVCTYPGYRDFVLYKLPVLKVLDSVALCSSERVAANMVLKPDMYTRTHHLRTKVELWNQLAAQSINVDTVPSDQPPVPLLILVGTFANRKEVIAEQLVQRFPEQIYRCKKYTTLPSENYYDPNNIISVSVDDFNNMIKKGQFIFHYKEIGATFGVSRDELCKCVVDGKVGLIDTIFEAAMIMRSSNLRPLMVLTVMDDTQAYIDKLKELFVDMNLWRKYQPSIVEKEEDSAGLKFSLCEENGPQDSSGNMNFTISNIGPNQLFKHMYYQFSTSPESSKHNSERKQCTLSLPDTQGGDYKKSELCSQHDEEDFVWTWSLDSSIVTVESEPRESYLNMMRGREKFVESTLQEQQMYIEINNLQPGLFMEMVITDDVACAVEKIKKNCLYVFNNRKSQILIEHLAEESKCTKLVEQRVKFLMDDVINISTEI